MKTKTSQRLEATLAKPLSPLRPRKEKLEEDYSYQN